MKNILISLCLLAAVAFLSSCDCIEGNGKVVTKSASVGSFTAIELKSDADIELVNDSSSTIYINAESNIVDLYKIDVEGNTLKIWSDECFSHHKPIKLKIPVAGRNLEEIKLSGSGGIKSSGPLKSDKILILLNGSGDFDLVVDAGEVKGKLNGSGRMNISGNAKNSEMVINGSGDIDASNLPANTVKADINGSGNCRVNAVETLKATVRGSGDIYYKGSAAVNSSIMGSGNIRKMD